MKIKEYPKPLASEINNLPDHIKSYLHDLETRADPAGDLIVARFAEDQMLYLEKLKEKNNSLEEALVNFINSIHFSQHYYPDEAELERAVAYAQSAIEKEPTKRWVMDNQLNPNQCNCPTPFHHGVNCNRGMGPQQDNGQGAAQQFGGLGMLDGQKLIDRDCGHLWVASENVLAPFEICQRCLRTRTTNKDEDET